MVMGTLQLRKGTIDNGTKYYTSVMLYQCYKIKCKCKIVLTCVPLVYSSGVSEYVSVVSSFEGW